MQVRYFYAMAGWYNGVKLTMTGHVGGIPIAQVTVTVSSSTHTKIVLPSDWPLVQTMYITTSGGTPGPYASIPSGQASRLTHVFSQGITRGLLIAKNRECLL